jgi:hypothetical protein
VDPTIYTLGDPLIVREALFALATIFNSSAWWDASSGFGLGGNLLAAALIGLIGILIAGINTQSMRVDYLLTAFVLFAIAFGTKTDVNVEDIQTGNTAVVADVPIGVAYVAAMTSSAAYDLTETVSTALQRVDSPTSTLTATGFLNPLKVMLSLRSLRLEELDPTLYETLLAYYRYCIGKTLEQPGSPFSQEAYLSAPNPLAYMLNPANVQNWTTVDYTEAAPEGVARGCHDTAVDIETRMADLTGGVGDELDNWSGRTLGTDAYNEGYERTDIEQSIDLMFRAGMDSQDFMASLLISNLHNAGEAWRIAEYGTDKSQYVATLTEAMEAQRVEVASEGSVFLQMMFPLMGFFQFLFFALPPLIAMIMIAAPMAAARILGFYLLFGVWAYGWMPVAAVINHYIQIAIQNDIEFARPGLLGSGYTAILGFNSLYNIIATKLVIGSHALASVPVILGALLSGTPFAVANIANRMSGGARVNSGVAAPSVMSNGPILQRAAMAGAPVGSVVSAGGRVAVASAPQRESYGSTSWTRTLTTAAEAANARTTAAREARSAAVQSAARTVQGVITSSEMESGQREAVRAALTKTLGTSYRDSVDADTQKLLTAEQAEAVQAAVGLRAFGSGVSNTVTDQSRWSDAQKSAYRQMLAKEDDLRASAAQELLDSTELETEVGESLRRDVETAKIAAQTAEQSEAFERDARETMRYASALNMGHTIERTRLAEVMLTRNGNALGQIRAIAMGVGGAELLNQMDASARAIFMETTPAGLDGRPDERMDRIDRIASSMQALEQMAGRDPNAAAAYLRALREVGGMAVPLDAADLGRAAVATEGARGTVSSGDDIVTSVAGERADVNAAIQRDGATVEALGAGIRSSATARKDISQQQAAWEASVGQEFAADRHGVRDAAANVDRAMAGAMAEQSRKVPAQVVDWLKPGSGFTAEVGNKLDGLPTGRGEEALQAGAGLVAELGGMVRAQGDFTSHPEKVYADFVKMGWSPKAAAQAAFAEVGARTSGPGELLAAGALGGGVVAGAARGAVDYGAASAAGARAAGAGAAARTALGMLARGGPVIGAIGVVGGAYLMGQADNATAATVDAQMREDLMGAVRVELGDAAADEFVGYLERVGGAQNAEELVNHVSQYFYGRSDLAGGGVGAYPGLAGDVQQRVTDWNQRIRDVD